LSVLNDRFNPLPLKPTGIIVPDIPEECPESTFTVEMDLREFITYYENIKTEIHWLWDQAEACCEDLRIQLAEQETTKRGMLTAS
jgi:hypothetical protein